MIETQTSSDFALKLGIGAERVRQLCKSGRIAGARRVTFGEVSVWLIPQGAADPRLNPGRPKAKAASTIQQFPEVSTMTSLSTFERIAIDSGQAERRLQEGRREAARVIAEMSRRGVTVELFGSMKSGKVFPTSDVDLLITDCGEMSPAEALYEIDLLAGRIPLDVTVLDYVPESSRKRILESIHG